MHIGYKIFQARVENLTYVQNILPERVENLRKHVRREKHPESIVLVFRPED
jgi:hypothetical protein